jgi:diguanylate cyclase (GGDEF)-like protein
VAGDLHGALSRLTVFRARERLMKISENRVSAPASRYAAAYSRTAAATAPSAAPAPADSASVLGIPAGELTPKVRDALMRLMQEVDTLRQELEQSRQRIAYLEQLADQDSLAPVANRRAFVRELSRTIAFSERYDSPSSVIYFDVNGLKPINDTFGHPAGDAALMQIADALVENVRGSDVVGRLGGDEFAVIPAHGDEAAAREKAETLAATIESSPLDWNGAVIPLHVSGGSTLSAAATAPATRWPPPTGRCTRTSSRSRPRAAEASLRRSPTSHAITSGSSRLRSRAIWSFSMSLRFFSRCICSWSKGPPSEMRAITSSRSRCSLSSPDRRARSASRSSSSMAPADEYRLRQSSKLFCIAAKMRLTFGPVGQN